MCDKNVNKEAEAASSGVDGMQWNNHTKPARDFTLVTFSAALAAVKNGGMIAREYWPRGVHAFMERGFKYFGNRDNGAPVYGVPVALFDTAFGGEQERMPALAISETACVMPGWVPTQADLFAEDWYVL